MFQLPTYIPLSCLRMHNVFINAIVRSRRQIPRILPFVGSCEMAGGGVFHVLDAQERCLGGS